MGRKLYFILSAVLIALLCLQAYSLTPADSNSAANIPAIAAATDSNHADYNALGLGNGSDQNAEGTTLPDCNFLVGEDANSCTNPDANSAYAPGQDTNSWVEDANHSSDASAPPQDYVNIDVNLPNQINEDANLSLPNTDYALDNNQQIAPEENPVYVPEEPQQKAICTMKFFGKCYEDLGPYFKKKADNLIAAISRSISGFAKSLDYIIPSKGHSFLPGENNGKIQGNKQFHTEKVHSSLLETLDVENKSAQPHKRIRVIIDASDEGRLSELASAAQGLGGTNAKPMKIGGLVSVEMPEDKVLELAGNDLVKKIYPEQKVSLLLNNAVPQIKAESFWHEGFEGNGVKVAVIDTGVDSSGDMLKGKVVLENNFTEEADARDSHGHGTFIAGIIAGSSKGGGYFDGVAPEASIISAKVLNAQGEGTSTSVIEAINWALDPDNDPSTDDGAKIINLSLGGPYYDLDSPLNKAVKEAVESGVFVVVSAGNCSAENPSITCNGFVGVTTPGNSPYAFTVGSVNSENKWASFSSGDAFGTGIKPDVSAPGVSITSSWLNNSYKTESGTSISSAFVSGLSALLLEANPSLTPYEMRELIEKNSIDLGSQGKDIKYGSGLIDANRIISSEAYSTPNFGLEVYSSSVIKTSINQQVKGRLQIYNSEDVPVRVIEILADPYIYYALGKNPIPAKSYADLNFEFHPLAIGLGEHSASIVFTTKEAVINHSLYIEVVDGSIEQEIDSNVLVQVGTIGAIYVNGVYILENPPPKLFGGENIEFNVYLTNMTGPSRSYSGTLKIINPSGAQICDLGYQAQYVAQGTSRQLIYNYPLSSGAQNGMYKVLAESWQDCTGTSYNGSCLPSGSYSCSYNHNSRNPNAFEVITYCSSGSCCDLANNHPLPSSTKCASNVSTEYRCTGSSKGSDVEIRHKDRYCSGTSSTCDGAEAWGAWQLYQGCSSSQLCDAANHTCNEDPVRCYSSSECGTNGWSGSPSCSADLKKVMQNYITWACNNPGTPSSTCSSTETPLERFNCEPLGQSCINGMCTQTYNDLCNNYDSYWCTDTQLWQCREDPSRGNHYNNFFINNCIGRTDCWTSADKSIGHCIDAAVKMNFDYALPATTVYKEPGDYFLLDISPDFSMQASFDYNTAYFDLVSGICTKGAINLSSGSNKCKFKVKESTPPSTYFFTITHSGINTQRGLRVTSTPSMVILTNKQKLNERFSSDPQGVQTLLQSAYNYARGNKAVIYDLSLYSFSAPHPFASFDNYYQNPTNPSMTDNSYVSQISSFAKARCPNGSCKSILILGDDYVVPYRRELMGKTVLSDYTFINSSSKPISANEDLLQRPAIFIIPDNVSGELRFMISKAETEYAQKHFVMPVEMKSSQVKCDSAFFSTLSASNIVLIGNKANNRAFTCNTYLEGGSIGNYSVRSNPWAIMKTSTYLITIKQDSLSEAEDALVYFYQKLDNPFFDSGAAEFIAACIGLKEEMNLGENALNLACNVIPVIELVADAVDSGKCLAQTDKTALDELICDTIHLASGYDIVQYGAVLITVGAAEPASEAGDIAIATIKTAMKNAKGKIANAVSIAAKSNLWKNPGFFGDLIKITLKGGDDATAIFKAWVEVISQGVDSAKSTFKMVDDFGELAAKNLSSLGRAVKGLGAEGWTTVQKKGLHTLIKNAPEAQGDAVMVAMKQSGEWTDDMAKQATELDELGNTKNVTFNKKLPGSENNLDWKTNLGGREDWIDSTTFAKTDTQEAIKLESPAQIWNKASSKSSQFADASGLNTTLVIDLQAGRTANMTKEVIRNTVQEIYSDPTQNLKNVQRVIFRDAITGEVFKITKP